MKQVCWRKCVWQCSSYHHVWFDVLYHHSIFTCLRYCLVVCGENATSFCAWMITRKDLSFLEKWNKDRVCFLLWPHYELMSVPALLRHHSHAAYSATIALHHEQQKGCSRLQCLIFSCCKIVVGKCSFEFSVAVSICYICILFSLWISALLRK